MDELKNCLTVTFGVIAYNEHDYISDLLNALLNQSYVKDKIEVILVDGGSTDDTKQIMKEFADKYSSFFISVKVLDNPKRVQPSGWNVVIKNATSDVILRIDAHARLPQDYVETCLTCLNSGEYVCGGPRENIIDEKTAWKQMLLEAERSMFGSGIALYRNMVIEKKYVKSVFHGAYRREVFDRVGLFNEDLIRTEDNEMHYRIRGAGYRICYDPAIHSYYQTRNSFDGMIKQKYQNGLWIGKTLHVCPGCISLFHMVPCLFVFAIIVTTVLIVSGISWPAIALWAAYLITNLGMSFMVVVSKLKEGQSVTIVDIALPFVFLALHAVYGIGTVVGFIER